MANAKKQGRQLLSEEEAAARLGLKTTTLRNWRCNPKRPDIPFVKLGHTVRYEEIALNEFIEANLHTRRPRLPTLAQLRGSK